MSCAIIGIDPGYSKRMGMCVLVYPKGTRTSGPDTKGLRLVLLDVTSEITPDVVYAVYKRVWQAALGAGVAPTDVHLVIEKQAFNRSNPYSQSGAEVVGMFMGMLKMEHNAEVVRVPANKRAPMVSPVTTDAEAPPPGGPARRYARKRKTAEFVQHWLDTHPDAHPDAAVLKKWDATARSKRFDMADALTLALCEVPTNKKKHTDTLMPRKKKKPAAAECIEID